MCSRSSHGEWSKPRDLLPRNLAGILATASSKVRWASPQPRARERCCRNASSAVMRPPLFTAGSSARNAVVSEVVLENVHLVLEVGDPLLHDVAERDHPHDPLRLVQDWQVADVVLRHR